MDKKLNEEFERIFEEMDVKDNDWFIKSLSEKDKEKVLLEILKQHPELAKNAIHDLFGYSSSLTTAANTKVLSEDDYRVCSDCGERLTEWYYYYGDYYCSGCRKKRWSDEEWFKEYEEAGGDDNDVIFWSSTF